jgi:hypothetical protein
MAAAGLGRIVGENTVTASRALAAAGVALELGGDLNAIDSAGNTALHYAAFDRTDLVVRFLVDRGASPNAKNSFGETPLWVSELVLQYAGVGTFHIQESSTGNLLRQLGAAEGITPSYDRARPLDWPDRPLAVRVSIDAFYDDFDDDLLDAEKWTNWGGPNVIERSQQLSLSTSMRSAQYFGIRSNGYFDLSGSNAWVKVVDAGNQALHSFQFFPLMLESFDGIFRLAFIISEGVLTAEIVRDGSSDAIATTRFDPSIQKYLRMREGKGTVFWEYSSDRVSWTELATSALAESSRVSPIAAMRQSAMVGTFDVEPSATTAVIDR